MARPISDQESAMQVGQQCALFAMRSASRSLTRFYDEAFRKIGLGANQFSLLNGIRATEPVAVSRLAEALGADQTTISRGLRPLVDQGLIQLEPGRDARVREARLTRKGRARIQAALPVWETAQSQLKQHLGTDRVERLLHDLKETAQLAQDSARTGSQ